MSDTSFRIPDFRPVIAWLKKDLNGLYAFTGISLGVNVCLRIHDNVRSRRCAASLQVELYDKSTFRGCRDKCRCKRIIDNG